MIALRRRTQQLTWVVLIGLLVAAFCFAQDGGDTPSAPEPPGQAEPAPAPTADDPPAPAPEPTPEPTPSEPDPTPEPVDEPAPEPESSDEADPGGPTPEDDAGGDPTDPVTDEEPATPGDPVDGEPSADGDEATEPTDEGGEAVVEGTDPAETEAADTDEPPAGEPADAAPTATVAPQPPPAKSQPPAREERPRKRTRVGPPPRPVSREVEKQRDETVQKSLEVLATPVDETSEVSDADRMAALSELSRQARMQLSALQTERSQFEAEHRRVHEIAEELENDGRRMPTLISTSKLPLMYAEDAQEWADETVADMNALFDETLSRRTELAQSLERYRSELADARQSAEALQGGPLTPVWDSALQVLADREEAASELVELFDKLVGETVDASEAGSQLSLDLNKAIQISLPRRLSARTATPIGGATFTATKDELTGLLGQARGAKQEATASIQSANMPVSGALSLVLLALAVTGWVLVPRVPGRILSQCDPHEGASGHLLRATRLLVPVGRFVVLIALWAGDRKSVV